MKPYKRPGPINFWMLEDIDPPPELPDVTTSESPYYAIEAEFRRIDLLRRKLQPDPDIQAKPIRP